MAHTCVPVGFSAFVANAYGSASRKLPGKHRSGTWSRVPRSGSAPISSFIDYMITSDCENPLSALKLPAGWGLRSQGVDPGVGEQAGMSAKRQKYVGRTAGGDRLLSSALEGASSAVADGKANVDLVEDRRRDDSEVYLDVDERVIRLRSRTICSTGFAGLLGAPVSAWRRSGLAELSRLSRRMTRSPESQGFSLYPS